MTTHESEIQTKRGKVRVTRTRRNRWRDGLVYEGRTEAVICAVADGLNGTTQCYEHMFRVEGVQLLATGGLRIECERNGYAGD